MSATRCTRRLGGIGRVTGMLIWALIVADPEGVGDPPDLPGMVKQDQIKAQMTAGPFRMLRKQDPGRCNQAAALRKRQGACCVA